MSAASLRVARAIARFTVLEALRSRIVLALGVTLVLLAGGLMFVLELALLERGAMAVSFAAPLVRLAAVVVSAVFAIALVSRELGDRSVDLSLAAPIARSTWVIGKWLGLSVVATVTASAAALPLLLLVPFALWWPWAFSLILEAITVAGLALLVTIALTQVAVSLLAVLALYAMARLIGVFLLLQARAPLLDAGGLNSLSNGVLSLLGLLLPRLDLFARTEWLLEGGAPALVGAVVQTALYAAVVLAVGCVDFGRRRG